MAASSGSLSDEGFRRVLPRGRHALDREVVRASQRERLLEAAAEVVTEKGYAAVTIDDVVKRAGTSRRTFYENFEDKEDCALVAFTRVADRLFEAIAERFDPAVPDQTARVKIIIEGIVDFLVENPVFAWIYFVDVNTISPAGVALAHDIRRRLAGMIIELRRDVRRSQPETPVLSEEHALALVGAMQEILAQAMHERGPERLGELSHVLIPLMVALLETDTRPPRSQRAKQRRPSRRR